MKCVKVKIEYSKYSQNDSLIFNLNLNTSCMELQLLYYLMLKLSTGPLWCSSNEKIPPLDWFIGLLGCKNLSGPTLTPGEHNHWYWVIWVLTFMILVIFLIYVLLIFLLVLNIVRFISNRYFFLDGVDGVNVLLQPK